MLRSVQAGTISSTPMISQPLVIIGLSWLQNRYVAFEMSIDGTDHEQDTFIAQHRLRAFDGSYRWFLARARCLRDVSGEREKWLGTSTDISDLTSALEEAKSTREHLLSITSAAKVHYFVLEDQGGQLKLTSLFLSGDQGLQRLYGYLDRDSLVNKDVQDVLPASLIAKVRCILSGVHEHETDEILANGNEYWRTQLYPLRKSNEYGSVLSGVVGEFA